MHSKSHKDKLSGHEKKFSETRRVLIYLCCDAACATVRVFGGFLTTQLRTRPNLADPEFSHKSLETIHIPLAKIFSWKKNKTGEQTKKRVGDVRLRTKVVSVFC